MSLVCMELNLQDFVQVMSGCDWLWNLVYLRLDHVLFSAGMLPGVCQVFRFPSS